MEHKNRNWCFYTLNMGKIKRIIQVEIVNFGDCESLVE